MQFEYHPLFEQAPVETEYRKLDIDGVSTETFQGQEMLMVSQDAIRQLTEAGTHGCITLASSIPFGSTESNLR